MKKFVNEKFLNSLFGTYCKIVDTLTDFNYHEECEIHSIYAYECIKLDSMLQAQENESNILVRRCAKTKNEIGRLYNF